MLLTGKVAGGESAFFHNSSLPKAFNYGKVCYSLAQSWQALPHKQLVSLPSGHSSVQTPKIQSQGHRILNVAHGATQNTHMANLTDQPCSLLPLGKQALEDSDSSALDGFNSQRLFLYSRDKEPAKNYSFSSRATDSYPLAQVTVSTTLLEPSTCGILKLCHIRYIMSQINSGKLYLKCAASCYWPWLERFSTVKHGSFSSNVLLAALAKMGQKLQICCCLPHLRQP